MIKYFRDFCRKSSILIDNKGLIQVLNFIHINTHLSIIPKQVKKVIFKLHLNKCTYVIVIYNVNYKRFASKTYGIYSNTFTSGEIKIILNCFKTRLISCHKVIKFVSLDMVNS